MKTKNKKPMKSNFNRKTLSIFLLLTYTLTTGALAQSENLVVIDKDYGEKEKLLTKLPTNVSILNLDGTTNPWKNIRESLETNETLTTVHLFAESSYNSILMGGISYDIQTLTQEAELGMLEGLYQGNNLQLLIYACNLASNKDGRLLLKRLGQMVYMNVGASPDCLSIFDIGFSFDFKTLDQPLPNSIIHQ